MEVLVPVLRGLAVQQGRQTEEQTLITCQMKEGLIRDTNKYQGWGCLVMVIHSDGAGRGQGRLPRGGGT